MTIERKQLPRRGFLCCVGGAVVAACGGNEMSAAVPGGTESTGSGTGGTGGCAEDCTGSTGGAGGAGGGPLACTASDSNIEGPYYRPDAPFRTDLTSPDVVGTPIRIRGRVLSPACEPLAGALLDFWQANDDGRYDNDGVDDPPNGEYVLRGRLEADGEGRYEVRTILPGRYLNGAQFRPAHVHVKVSAPGYGELTTQLYFEGDPYNDVDPFIVDSLIMTLADEGGDQVADFDFVLSPG